MTADNLAIVFAPCLFRNPDLMAALKNAQQEIQFTALLIRALPLSSASEQQLAADRAAYWHYVSAATEKPSCG